MDMQEVKWEQYPRIAAHPVTRAFVERLALVRFSHPQTAAP